MRVYFFLLLMLLISCKTHLVQEPYLPQLHKITVDGKTLFTFDYDKDGKLLNEKQYLNCDNEFREITYRYAENRLVSRVVRQKQFLLIWSPTYSILPLANEEDCSDRATYQMLTNTPEYDQSGKVSKIVSDDSSVEYVYKPNGTIEATLDSGSSLYTKYSWYDNEGNLIEEKEDTSGVIVQGSPIGYFFGDIPNAGDGLIKYEYDAGHNPLYTPTIWPFQLPNNIVKRYGKNDKLMFEWSYKYDERGFPLERTGSDGAKWIYHYQ